MTSPLNDSVSSMLSAYYSSANAATSSSSVAATTTTTTTSTTTTTQNTSYSNKSAVGRYFNSTDSSKVSARNIFENLSIDMGGDGKTITKDQLNKYIAGAQNKTVKMPDEELSALKDIQKNWDTISNGSDKIDYSDVYANGYTGDLLSMAPEDTTSSTTDYRKLADESTASAYGKVVNAALNGLSNNSDSKTNIQDALNALLKGTTDENDDANADEIAKYINMLAQNNKTSTIDLLVE